MNVLLSPANAPFLVALGLMLSIGLLEMLALLVGMSMFHHIDSFFSAHIDADGGEGILSQGLGWLHVGRVPMLVLIVLFLGSFSLIGFIGQWILTTMLNYQLPTMFAGIGSLCMTIPAVRIAGNVIAHYIPKDESSAVSEDSFVGRIATMTGMSATLGNPAEAKLNDEHKQVHYILVEPDEEGVAFARGDSVLIVSRISGTGFRAIVNPRPDLL